MQPTPALGVAVPVDVGRASRRSVEIQGAPAHGDRAPERRGRRRDDLGGGEQLAPPRRPWERVEGRAVVLVGQFPGRAARLARAVSGLGHYVACSEPRPLAERIGTEPDHLRGAIGGEQGQPAVPARGAAVARGAQLVVQPEPRAGARVGERVIPDLEPSGPARPSPHLEAGVVPTQPEASDERQRGLEREPGKGGAHYLAVLVVDGAGQRGPRPQEAHPSNGLTAVETVAATIVSQRGEHVAQAAVAEGGDLERAGDRRPRRQPLGDQCAGEVADDGTEQRRQLGGLHSGVEAERAVDGVARPSPPADHRLGELEPGAHRRTSFVHSHRPSTGGRS